MIVKLGDKMLTLAKVFGLVDCRAISLKEAVTLSGYSYWHLTRRLSPYFPVKLFVRCSILPGSLRA